MTAGRAGWPGRAWLRGRVALGRPSWQAIDVAVAVLLAAGGVFDALTADGMKGPRWIAVVLAPVTGGVVAFRRRAPLGANVVYFSVMVLQAAFVWDVTNAATPFLALFLLPYAAAAFTDGWRTFAGLAVALAGFVGVELVTAEIGVGDVLFMGGFILGSWLAGRAVRVRARLAIELHEAAVRAEEERDAEAARATAEERRRIARELHDVVAHSVSVMVVQAGGARRILDQDPARAVQAAERIEATGRSALVEMRRLLGVLHAGEDEDAARAPAPTLAGVDALVEDARTAGLPVTLAVEGERRALPAGLDLAAYRVVQEALTNALKHAAAETAVTVRWGADALELEVADRGPGPAAARRPARPDGTGHGLIGMRERVRVYGGELHTGRRRGGGFAVRARLPLSEENRIA